MSEAVIQFLYFFLSHSLACWQPTRNFHKNTKLFTSQQQPMMNFPELGKLKCDFELKSRNLFTYSRLYFMLHVMWWCDAISQRPTQASVSALRLTMLWQQQLHCHSSAEYFEHLIASFSSPFFQASTEAEGSFSTVESNWMRKIINWNEIRLWSG